MKNTFQKPGDSIHSPKWDRCVEQVESHSKNANAYAVCTAMLGDSSFKSMEDSTFEEKMKMYMEKLGIAGAGSIPNSLLADQDLEGVTKREDLWLWRQGEEQGGQEVNFDSQKFMNFAKTFDLNNFAVWYYDDFGARKCAVFGNAIDAMAYAKLVDAMGFKDIQILKGQFEQTGKELKEAAEDAEDAEGKNETKSLVERIKGIQLKRQKTVLSMRGADTQKSFRQTWGDLNKKV